MDNVLNRPLFRHREARDRLNESAGVQRFRPGGEVFADPSGAIQRQYQQPSVVPMGTIPNPVMELSLEPVILNPGTTMAQQFLYDRNTGQVRFPDGSRLPPGTEANISELLRQQEEVTTGTGLASLQRELARKTAQSQTAMSFDEGATGTMLAEEAGRLRSAIPGAEAAFSEAQNRAVVSPGIDRGLTALEGPEAVVSQMSPEELDIFNNLDRAADRAAPDVLAPGAPVLGPSGMEMEARGQGPRAAGSASDGTQPAAPAGRSTMEADARDRGPLISSPADVAAGLNAPDPAVREKTVQDFMKEYVDAAPKYEGADKGLLLAQIGFAIAAGESPNAMQNIANGLLAGSDMMLKDKAAKDEFNRQVQLSAMQYGFGEAASQRALERQFTDYVASREVTYRGKKYGPNESVPVLHSDIINGRMPDGVITEGSSDALLASEAAVRKSMAEALKDQILTPAAYQEAINTLDTAASDYSSARNLMPLLEASLVRAANGEVTGLDAALTRKMNEVMNAVGLKPEAEYESPEAFESALREVSVSMVQDLLGESGKTISDADRKLIDGLIGLQQDFVSGAIKDPDILTRKVQQLMRVLESKQRNALDAYTTAMEGYGGTYTPSGTPLRSFRAERVFNEEAAAPAIQYEWDQANNRLVLKKSGG